MVTITKASGIKLVELVIVIVLLILHYDAGVSSRYENLLTNTAFGGYLIILIGLFMGAFSGTPVNRRIDCYFTFLGAILFIVCGILILDSKIASYVVRGVLAIIQGVILVFDAIWTFRGEA